MNNEIIVPEEIILSKIYNIRSKKVMLDRDLAELYGVETRTLAQSVRRNEERFPDDFMFQLTKDEHENLISQNVTSSWGGTRKLPLVFTEQGVAMLSGVLRSKTAIKVNIYIIRVFVKVREMLTTHDDVMSKLQELESKVGSHDKSMKQIFQLINRLLYQENNRKLIGYKSKPLKSK